MVIQLGGITTTAKSEINYRGGKNPMQNQGKKITESLLKDLNLLGQYINLKGIFWIPLSFLIWDHIIKGSKGVKWEKDY